MRELYKGEITFYRTQLKLLFKSLVSNKDIGYIKVYPFAFTVCILVRTISHNTTPAAVAIFNECFIPN